MRRIGTASVGLAVAGAIGVLLWAWRRGGGHRKSVWLGPRKGREAALRVAATELGLSTSIRRSVQLIAEYAVRTTRAQGAYVERLEGPVEEGVVEVVAVVGSGAPTVGTRIPYRGSLTEELIESGRTEIVTGLGRVGEGIAAYLKESCQGCRVLVVPLGDDQGVLGALVLSQQVGRRWFTRRDVAQIRAFGGLVTAALRQLRLGDELRESEARFHQLADHLDVVIWLGAPDLSARYYVNPAYERIFGRSRESFYRHPRSPVEAVHPEDRERVEVELQRLSEGGEYDVTYRIIRPDGETRWIRSRSYPIWNEEGELYRVAGIMEDITERQLAESELHTRVEQLNAVAVLSQFVLAETRLDAVFRRAVEVTAQELGVEFVELLELTPDGRELLLRDGIGWRAGVLGHARISAKRESMAGYTLLSSEPVITMDLRSETRFRGSWLLTEHGVVSGLSVIVHGRHRPWGVLGAYTRRHHRYTADDIIFLQSVSNILAQSIELRRVDEERERVLELKREARRESERIRREEERSRIALQRITESRSRLMRGFSHDVKNPLGAADGFLQLMEEGVLDELTPKQRDGVSRARRAIGEAISLISDLLTIARAESGTIEVERVPTDLEAIILGVVEDFQAKAAMKEISLRAELPAELPEIESDADRIRQILGNLLSNAVKYTDQGGVVVAAKVEEAEDEGWLTISVTDTGPGIPEAQQATIFNEFRRVAEKEARESQGIGLAISRRIAEALGGEITVWSEPGRGSTFTLWLPMD